MAKGVFTTKVEPSYDDLPELRYHFPRTYLRSAEATVGDWIVYYEPRRTSADLSSRGGRQSYFATARVDRIEQDLRRRGHYYAHVTDYLEFDRPVSFRDGFELALIRDDGGTNKGQFGRAVRPISDEEYESILRAGFRASLHQPELGIDHIIGALEESQTPFIRPMVERLVIRPFRDAIFSERVRSVYENTCAVTGLRIINGGGRPEVQAAHIHPVSLGGPDSFRNGIALSGTIHWMFDRGLISIGDDYEILIAPESVPDTISRLINPDRRLRVPDSAEYRPHPNFLRFHRTNIFKG